MKHLDTAAAEMIPIRLLISIFIITAIMLLVATASVHLRVSLAEQQVEQECREVQSALSTMIASGVARDVDARETSEGTIRIQTMMLPDSLVYLSFGGTPDPQSAGALRPTLTEDGSLVCYKVQGGTMQVIWFPRDTFKFREGLLQGDTWIINKGGESFIIRHGGSITLKFELVQQNHIRYILIHANDGIDEE
jgi:hypothetical protein